MKKDRKNFRLGMFLISGVLLLLFMLYFFGASDLFTSKVRLYTVFPESVQGLTVGAPVKYRGAPVGTVSKIYILLEERMVCVEMDISLDSFQTAGYSYDAGKFDKLLNREILGGLRSRLEFSGITGLKFIDLDYFGKQSDEAPAPPADKDMPDAHYVPSVPSTFKDITSTVATAMERLGKVPFEEIADGINRSLNDVSNILGDPALLAAIHRINDTAENLEASTTALRRVLQEDQLNALITLFKSNLTSLEKLINQIYSEMQAMKLAQTTGSLRTAAGSFTGMQEDLENTMQKINQMVDAVRMLCDYLGTDPNSLVNGKKSPVISE